MQSIDRSLARAAALGRDLKVIAGTSLDKGVKMDALAKLAPDQRAGLIERAASGEQVSARDDQQRKTPGATGARTYSELLEIASRYLADAEAAAIAIEECTAAQRSLVPAYDRLLAALAAVQDCMNQIYARTKEIKGEVLVDWNAIA